MVYIFWKIFALSAMKIFELLFQQMRKIYHYIKNVHSINYSLGSSTMVLVQVGRRQTTLIKSEIDFQEIHISIKSDPTWIKAEMYLKWTSQISIKSDLIWIEAEIDLKKIYTFRSSRILFESSQLYLKGINIFGSSWVRVE